MPKHKNALSLEVLFGFGNVFDVVLTIVGDLSPHIINHKWLCEVVLVVVVWHCFEVHGHGGAGLNVADLVVAYSGAHVSVKEFGDGRSVLGEVRVLKTSLPLLIVVDDVEGLW